MGAGKTKKNCLSKENFPERKPGFSAMQLVFVSAIHIYAWFLIATLCKHFQNIETIHALSI